MCARFWLSAGVCLVLLIEGALGDCLLPKNPAHGRLVAHGGDCGGEERPPACDGNPGSPAPEDWLLVVQCDPGYQPENQYDSDVPSICTKGVWSRQHLPRCVVPDLLTNERQRCIVPNPPPNSQYRMFPEECGAESLPPGSQVPQDCILFLTCKRGYQRKLGKGDYLTHCTNKTWSPSIPNDLCISTVNIDFNNGGGNYQPTLQPLPETLISPTDCVLPNTSPSRRFCSLEKGCAEHCTFHNDRCLVSPGSKVKQVKVVCDEGYTTGTSNSISVCLGNQLYPPLPECLKLCPPRKSEMLQLTCRLGSSIVNCNDWAVPSTTVTLDCAPTFSKYPDLVREGVYGRTQYCTRYGEWSHRLPICKPACGVFNRNIQVFSPTIINGEKAHLGFFPWHAGIYYRSEKDGKISWDQRCGGSLISDRFILTAAHCLVEYTQDVSQVRIALGKYHRSWDNNERTQEKRNVLAISIPSDYTSATLTFDIALVLLNERIKFGQFIMPVCLDYDTSGDSDFRNRDLFVVGWGKTSTELDGKASDVLLYNSVKPLSNKDCRRRVPAFYNMFEKICGIKSNSESVTQQGDSGGGLTAVYRDDLHYLVGIVSTKVDRVSIFTYTKWKTHIDWMESEMTRLKNLHSV